MGETLIIGLSHIGGALPNIALMRVSAYYKERGDTVILNPKPLDHPDKLFVSLMFTWRRRQAEELIGYFQPTTDVLVGGSGWDLSLKLPAEIDACKPDYELYGVDYGMGYSSRGCVRSCAFCPVPKAEGGIREDTAIGDLINQLSNKLMFLDNNFFASDWQPKVREIEERGLVVDWPQGLDIRLMTPEMAQALWRLKERHQISGDRFTAPGVLHFAWDLPANDARRNEVVRGIQMLFGVGFKPRYLRFLVLVGYPGYRLEEELERIRTLHELGIEPYVMVYRDYGEQDNREPERLRLQHWNNGHAWRRVPFSEFRMDIRGTKAKEPDGQQASLLA